MPPISSTAANSRAFGSGRFVVDVVHLALLLQLWRMESVLKRREAKRKSGETGGEPVSGHRGRVTVRTALRQPRRGATTAICSGHRTGLAGVTFASLQVARSLHPPRLGQ